MTSQYLVACDGARSRVRDWAGIPFPGTTCPEVNRLAQVTLPDAVTVLDNGDLDVPGFGTIHAGFTRTDRGLLGIGSSPASKVVSLYTAEDETTEAGRILLAGDAAHLFPATGVALNAGMLDAVDLAWKLAADIHGWAPADLLDTYHNERHLAGDRAMLHTRAQVALRRGHDPAAEALRQVFQELLADEQPLRRMGALVAGADIRYPTPGSNHHVLTGTFAPDLTLHTDQGTISVAKLMHTARPPDAHIAWAATIDEPADTAAPALRQALSGWFGTP
ncbi:MULTISPECIES: FAD-dependent monooxygenase [Streptomyces]|uniref:FAD-dependent monooxygenase n=1 Tax=Streptomyces TaxID=1883 RepID=UPI001EE644A3|nr:MULTISPECIES: FAD-dependent monooxygenase [Streptomyces]